MSTYAVNQMCPWFTWQYIMLCWYGNIECISFSFACNFML